MKINARVVILISIIVVLVFGEILALDRKEPSSEPQNASFAALPSGIITDPDFKETIILAGDGGKPNTIAVETLARHAAIVPDSTTVFLLGDNIYENGLLPEAHQERAESERRLNAQIDPLKGSGARVVFIPGNHDWDDAGPDGWNAIKRQEAMIVSKLGKGSFYPSGGCPGPVVIKGIRESELSIVLMDSEWFLRNDQKPTDASTGCSAWTEEIFQEQLAAAVKQSGKYTLILAHHPLQTIGKHSERDDSQSLLHPRYSHYRNLMFDVLRLKPPLICAAGHDHSLQVLRGDDVCRNYLVSGAISKPTGVTPNQNTIFSALGFGFMRVDFLNSGGVRLRVLASTTEDSYGKVLYESRLE